jgi:hypothetical protein
MQFEFKRFRTVLIAPKDNVEILKIKIPALQRFGTNIVSVWRALLYDPNSFIFCTTEELVANAAGAVLSVPSLGTWYRYITDRYRFG